MRPGCGPGAGGQLLTPPEARGCSIGLFGTFFPEGGFAGNTTTGVAAALARSRRVESVTIFSQIGSELAGALSSSKLRLRPIWRHDDALSIARAGRTMRSLAGNLDGFVFNLYLTSFGRSRLANGIGLLLPPLLAARTGKPVVVYMHNFLETQDVAGLGYRPSHWQRLSVELLESFLVRRCTVAVPLRSQLETLRARYGSRVHWVPLPFREPFGLQAVSPPMAHPPAASPGSDARILLLGSWGPQKDLFGALRAVALAHDRGGRFTVSLTGNVNAHFPEYRTEVERAVASLDPTWFRYLGDVPEDRLLDVVRRHDLLLLPYRATGGFSAAMSLGAYCGLNILSYDLPQLRETAAQLGVTPTFVDGANPDQVVTAILSFCDHLDQLRALRVGFPPAEYDARFLAAVDRLIDLFPPNGLASAGT